MKRLVARLYRRLPLPYWLQAWLMRRVAPSFLVGVAGVVLNERGEILLLEHVFHRAYPWGLPGGWMARGESPAQALRRELREEIGLEIEVERLLAIEPDSDPHYLQIGYLCRTLGQPDRLNYEILSVRWVAPGDLPGPIPPFHQELIARAVG
jgi:ADP-ribose pyrophosphatase YjhB (NUDIX family)